MNERSGSGHWRLAVATLCGIGYCRPASGTWASVATAAVAWWVATSVHASWLPACFVSAAMIFFMIGVPASAAAARYLGRGDPSQVVVDEAAGMCAALAVVPSALLGARPLATTVAALALFRLFDIVKPWPVASLEALPGGWGIMADDIAAGLLAGAFASATIG